MKEYTQINRVDVRATSHTVTAYIGGMEILSKCKGRPWTVGADVEDLGGIIAAAAALMEYERGGS